MQSIKNEIAGSKMAGVKWRGNKNAIENRGDPLSKTSEKSIKFQVWSPLGGKGQIFEISKKWSK